MPRNIKQCAAVVENDGNISKSAGSGDWVDIVGDASIDGSTAADGPDTQTISLITRKTASGWINARGFLFFDLIMDPKVSTNFVVKHAFVRIRTVASDAGDDGDIGRTIKPFLATVDRQTDDSLVVGDYDAVNLNITSVTETVLGDDGSVADFVIDGNLRSELQNRLRRAAAGDTGATGHIGIALLPKLDYDHANQDDPTGLNRIRLAATAHATSQDPELFIIGFEQKPGVRVKRKAGGGGFGEVNIPSTSMSGFAGER